MKTALKKPTRTLIFIMIVLAISGILIARAYYGNINQSIDPRVKHARELYSQYDKYAQVGDFYKVLALLDSIENIYSATNCYKNSYELGVLYNNRAATLLTIGLYADSIPALYNPYTELNADSIVSLSEDYVMQAISIYHDWDSRFSEKSSEQIRESINVTFLEGFEEVDPKLQEKYLDARVKEIEKSLQENQRRLSVCYTNLGIVYREKGLYKDAVIYYEKALSLWDRNLTAENNLNRLLGKPLKKRNFIQKIFPPDRDQ